MTVDQMIAELTKLSYEGFGDFEVKTNAFEPINLVYILEDDAEREFFVALDVVAK